MMMNNKNNKNKQQTTHLASKEYLRGVVVRKHILAWSCAILPLEKEDKPIYWPAHPNIHIKTEKKEMKL